MFGELMAVHERVEVLLKRLRVIDVADTCMDKRADVLRRRAAIALNLNLR